MILTLLQSVIYATAPKMYRNSVTCKNLLRYKNNGINKNFQFFH